VCVCVCGGGGNPLTAKDQVVAVADARARRSCISLSKLKPSPRPGCSHSGETGATNWEMHGEPFPLYLLKARTTKLMIHSWEMVCFQAVFFFIVSVLGRKHPIFLQTIYILIV